MQCLRLLMVIPCSALRTLCASAGKLLVLSSSYIPLWLPHTTPCPAAQHLCRSDEVRSHYASLSHRQLVSNEWAS